MFPSRNNNKWFTQEKKIFLNKRWQTCLPNVCDIFLSKLKMRSFSRNEWSSIVWCVYCWPSRRSRFKNSILLDLQLKYVYNSQDGTFICVYFWTNHKKTVQNMLWVLIELSEHEHSKLICGLTLPKSPSHISTGNLVLIRNRHYITVVNRVFPKIDHSARSDKVVLVEYWISHWIKFLLKICWRFEKVLVK